MNQSAASEHYLQPSDENLHSNESRISDEDLTLPAYQTFQFAEEVGEEFGILVVDDEAPSGPFTILDVDPDPDDDESNDSKM